jgi:hypothetical protein
MDRAAALEACKSLLENAISVADGVSGERNGVPLTMKLGRAGWEIATVVETRGHAFLLQANSERETDYRVVDGQRFESVSTPPALLDTVLTASHTPRDDAEYQRWQRLALLRLEAKDDALCATFTYHYYGVDAELLADGLDVVLRLRAGVERAIAALPEAAQSIASAERGPYRSALVHAPADAVLPVEYVRKVHQIERRRFVLRVRHAVPFILMLLFPLLVWLFSH